MKKWLSECLSGDMNGIKQASRISLWLPIMLCVVTPNTSIIFANNFILANSSISKISGYCSENSLHFEGGEITDTIIEDVSVYDGYIYTEGTKFFSLDILNFRRLCEKEALPSKYSFVAAKCPDCTLICDGIPLDAVILSKKSVPDVKITAAKLASVSPSVYNYTAELPLDRNHTYIIPCGGFDSLSLFSEKD